MNTKHWLLPSLFAVLLVFSGPSYAHDSCHNAEGDRWHEKHGMPDLSDEQKMLLHETMKKSVEKDKPLFAQMKKLHEKMHAIVAADNFDSKAFLANAAQMQKLHDRVMNDHIAAFASVAGQFTPAQREAIIRHFAKHHHGMRHGDNHHEALADGPGDSPSTPQPAHEMAYPPYPKR